MLRLHQWLALMLLAWAAQPGIAAGKFSKPAVANAVVRAPRAVDPERALAPADGLAVPGGGSSPSVERLEHSVGVDAPATVTFDGGQGRPKDSDAVLAPAAGNGVAKVGEPQAAPTLTRGSAGYWRYQHHVLKPPSFLRTVKRFALAAGLLSVSTAFVFFTAAAAAHRGFKRIALGSRYRRKP